MRPRPWAVAVGVVGVAAACVLVFLGIAVLAVSRDARTDDQRLLASQPDPDATAHARGLRVRVGESILGVADDRTLRDGVALARAATLGSLPDEVVLRRRAEAEAILSVILRGDGDRAVRSSAANLLGVLFFEDAKIARTNPRRYLDLSFGSFRDAVLLDPGDVDAKANLELLATLPPSTAFRKAPTAGENASASPGAPGGY